MTNLLTTLQTTLTNAASSIETTLIVVIGAFVGIALCFVAIKYIMRGAKAVK